MNNFDINKINMYDMLGNNLYENCTLNELKTLLYIKTKNNNTEEVDKIKNIINNKIKQQSNNINNNEIDEDLIKFKSNIKSNIKISKKIENKSESDDSTSSIKSEDLLVKNEDINKLYDRVDKKGQNQRFTQTSKKLFDRMFSEASYINKIGTDNIVVKPFSDNNIQNPTKLGMRKNIMRN